MMFADATDKWGFIRGRLETSGSISVNGLRVVLRSQSKELLQSMAGFVGIPYHMTHDELVYEDTNAIDLLGCLYNNHENIADYNPYFYNKYLSILEPIGKGIVYRTCEEAVLPSKSRVSDVGYDLTVISKVKELNNVVSLYDTGIRIRVPHGYYTEVIPRSSLSKSGYMMANSVGVIDRSYNGNIYVALAKIDAAAPEIKFPFRCCQLVFRKQHHVLIEEIPHDLSETARGDGGFGSTG